jgi:hypothetical protein
LPNSGGSEEDRIKSYAYQKQRLAHLRAIGVYDDSQGKVFKR